MLKIGDKGIRVAELQEALIELGERLPRWGIDKIFGEETLRAAKEILSRYRDKSVVLHDGPHLSVNEIAFIFTLRNAKRGTNIPKLTKLVDRRAHARLSKDLGPRQWNEIYGWCLHQTACLLSSSKKEDRCDHIGAHWVVYPDGKKFLLHDINRKVVHGNAWNAHMIGIEIDGLFAGIEGNENTVWDNPETSQREVAQSVTKEQIQAVKDIIMYDRALIRSHGGVERMIVSHRQSSASRRNDPGSKVWKEIALPMIEELGLEDGSGLESGGGLRIPEQWDPRKGGVNY